MSIYVMVTADFPDIKSEDRTQIYGCLRKERWNKIENVERDVSTVWYKPFEDSLSYGVAVEISKSEFIKCSQPFTIPRLVIHVGPKEPLVY